jgi:hypothetical protein
MNLDTLNKKRKAEEAFEEYEYVYGIVTTSEKNTLANLFFFFPPLFCITNLFYNFLATNWYFILHRTEAIYCTSKTEYRISLTEDALKDSTDLRKNVKRILEVIVGLLKEGIS